ncbi:MAG: hypothetical protein C0467_09850 [Planctomycetaceae bacterium]|nr:hypothetical protein [Planctomycetaceae bacterium]
MCVTISQIFSKYRSAAGNCMGVGISEVAMSASSRGLFSFVARLQLPPAADSDADLLERFIRTADESSFAGLVRRHGPMVMSVCRRQLGRDSDAEDAFQAVFLALATSARSIGQRDSIAGWLYRVAYLISLKAAGRRARLPASASLTAEVPMPEPPTSTWETQELKAIIDSELAGLPDKFRAVVVLCLIEGQSNSEAAAALGVPVGTVDSRLSTARKRLQNRLTRRGIALGIGITLEQVLGGPLGAADRSAIQELVSITVRAVLAEAAGHGAGALSPAVANLANGVGTMMTTKLRLAGILCLTLGLLGGAGAGIYYATAADPAKPVAKAPIEKLTALAPMPVQADPNVAPPEVKKIASEVKAEGSTGAVLLKPFGVKVEFKGGVAISDIFHRIEEMSDLVIRVDVAAFRRVGILGADMGTVEPSVFLESIYQTKVSLPPKSDKLPIVDVLSDALAQVIVIDHPCTFQLRGSQLLIVPAFVPPSRPGVNPLDPNSEGGPIIGPKVLNEQIYGGVVSVAAERKPLADILGDLRKQSGANIILDPRCEGQEKKAPLTLTLGDVRLYDALRVIADMADLKLVYAGNIYYVTTAANAKQFQPLLPPPMIPQP